MKEHFDSWTQGYLNYLRDVGRKARGTVRDVRCTLKRVRGAMQSLQPDVPLWKLPLADYLKWLEQERGVGTSPQTLAKYLSHVRGLLDYTWRSGRSDRNVLDGFQLQDTNGRVKPRCLTENEAKKLVAACPSSTPLERRERVMVLLLYGCGLRTEELCQLGIQDVNSERKELFIEHGKGDRQRYVPIPAAVYTELLAYLAERGGKRGPLFRTQARGRRLSNRDVCEVVRHAAQRAELSGDVTPKVLRHSYATHLMDRGVDLAVIASLMGHRSPQETGVYLHVLGNDPEKAVARLEDAP